MRINARKESVLSAHQQAENRRQAVARRSLIGCLDHQVQETGLSEWTELRVEFAASEADQVPILGLVGDHRGLLQETARRHRQSLECGRLDLSNIARFHPKLDVITGRVIAIFSNELDESVWAIVWRGREDAVHRPGTAPTCDPGDRQIGIGADQGHVHRLATGAGLPRQSIQRDVDVRNRLTR